MALLVPPNPYDCDASPKFIVVPSLLNPTLQRIKREGRGGVTYVRTQASTLLDEKVESPFETKNCSVQQLISLPSEWMLAALFT